MDSEAETEHEWSESESETSEHDDVRRLGCMWLLNGRTQKRCATS